MHSERTRSEAGRDATGSRSEQAEDCFLLCGNNDSLVIDQAEILNAMLRAPVSLGQIYKVNLEQFPRDS